MIHTLESWDTHWTHTSKAWDTVGYNNYKFWDTLYLQDWGGSPPQSGAELVKGALGGGGVPPPTPLPRPLPHTKAQPALPVDHSAKPPSPSPPKRQTADAQRFVTRDPQAHPTSVRGQRRVQRQRAGVGGQTSGVAAEGSEDCGGRPSPTSGFGPSGVRDGGSWKGQGSAQRVRPSSLPG